MTRSYPKTDTFDIVIGMTVFDAGGEKIGTITEIAGFGSQQTAAADAPTATQAQSGTGHFTVDCTAVAGAKAKSMCIPFSRIHSVTPDHGVTLTEAVIAPAHDSQDATSPHTGAGEPTPQRWWRAWRSPRRS